MKKPKSQKLYENLDIPMSVVRLSILKGTGVDIDELREKPMVAVVNSFAELNPGHSHLRLLAQYVKDGINAGGGIAFEFNVPAPCDGVAEANEGMRFILPQRELIADMIETYIRSQLFDGMVLLASCDKIIPGMLLACARLDLPAIFITGGPCSWQIRFEPKRKESVDHKDYDDLALKSATATCASFGACEIMGTANTMQSLTEALGMALPGSSNIPAFHSDKLRYARKTGMRIVEMIEEELTARKILTPLALENALMVDLAIGGSTNSTLHLPALAYELGIDFPLSRFNEFNKKIPTLCGISPNGPYGVIDLYKAGGVLAVMKRLEEKLNLEVLTVTGKTLKEVLNPQDIFSQVQIKDEKVIRPLDNPYLPEGGTAVLFGNLAPQGAVVKQSAVKEDMLVFEGKARIADSEEQALDFIRKRELKEGEVLVIRYEGPKGGPGMPEMLSVTMFLELAGYHRVALITDGRFSGASAGPCIGHISPEAYAGGPIAGVKDGDEIYIDIPARKLEVNLTPSQLEERLKDFKPLEKPVPNGYIKRYRKWVAQASQGAVLKIE